MDIRITTLRITYLAALAMLSTIISVPNALAQDSSLLFRGIPLGEPNLSALNLELSIDVQCSFADDSGTLAGQEMHGMQVGFIAPWEFDADGNPVPNGLLTGDAEVAHGRWSPTLTSSDYVVVGGNVSRTSNATGQIAYSPWRVTEDVGEVYLLEMTAIVAPGESVRLGYIGDPDPDVHNATAGLIDGGLGQLTMELTRGVDEGPGGTDNSQTIEWAVLRDDGQSGVIEESGTLGFVSFPVNEEFKMQLGWNEVTDTFDVWLGTSQVDPIRLIQGELSTDIDVFGIGFELTGTGSQITLFLAAVPEPSTYVLMAMGLLLLGGYGFKQRRVAMRQSV